MFQIILYIFLAYLAYRFIFGLVLPIYRTTRQVKRQFNEMRSRMEGQQDINSGSTQDTQPQSKEKVGDYIDFEEVK